MKKMVIDAQEHFSADNKHEVRILLLGMPKEHISPGLIGLGLREMREIGPFICVNCPETEMLELEYLLGRLDEQRIGFGLGSMEQLTDELLANLGKEVLTLNDMRLESIQECLVLPKKQATYGVNKAPLKSLFNNRSRQINKSVRRKR